MGGLGFKDLHLFNQSLVAKQAWRLINHPSSIAARVLKGEYFQASNFLRVEVEN